MSDQANLTSAEAAQLAALHAAWTAARAARDYARADPLRTQLAEWGALGPQLDRWHPVFESSAHRSQRLAQREATPA
jgi:cysteinyl-tRNA synthetase